MEASIESRTCRKKGIGQSVDEIAATHDLPHAGIHAALAYSFDHLRAIDDSLHASEAWVETMNLAMPLTSLDTSIYRLAANPQKSRGDHCEGTGKLRFMGLKHFDEDRGFGHRWQSRQPEQNHPLMHKALAKGKFAEILVLGHQHGAVGIRESQNGFVRNAGLHFHHREHLMSRLPQTPYDGEIEILVRNKPHAACPVRG